MIRFENVTKRFKDKTVLKGIDFEIAKGEFVVLVGKSGCGKTTTLKMINRLIEPSSGSIYIDDKEISKMNVIDLRRNMGYVIQQTGLFPHMTIRDNIELIAKLEKKDKKEITKKTSELLKMVGLDDFYLERYPNELSGGQQQRIGVARAFALDPDIILMDEPFSALDPITREDLQDELVVLQQKMQKTIVFVTHDMDEAVKIADKICIMDQGNIVQFDTPENVLKHPKNEFISEFVGRKRIWGSPELIKAEDIMITHPVTCQKNLTLFRAVNQMKKKSVDSLMVVDKDSKELLGILTAKFSRKQSDQSILVEEAMITDYDYVYKDDSIIDILNRLNEIDISSIPVVDEDKHLIGLLTKASLITTLSSQYIDGEEDQDGII